MQFEDEPVEPAPEPLPTIYDLPQLQLALVETPDEDDDYGDYLRRLRRGG